MNKPHIDMQELYDKNDDFKRYVDKYCNTHHIFVKDALEFEMIKEVAIMYNSTPSVVNDIYHIVENVATEDKSC